MPKGQKQPVFVWKNAEYPCGEHLANHKWPTEEGGFCTALINAENKCTHFFNDRFQANRLGWNAERKEGAYSKEIK